METGLAQSMELERLEKKMYTSFHQDGIIDLFIGLLLAVDGILMLTDNNAFVGIAVILIVMIIPVKNMVTVPRLGMVQLSSNRSRRLSKSLILSVALGLIVLMIFVMYQPGTPLNDRFYYNYNLFFAGVFLLFTEIRAYLTNLNRFSAYAGLILIIFTAGYLIPWSLPVSLIILGLTVALTGAGVLFQFLKNNPKPSIQEDFQNGG